MRNSSSFGRHTRLSPFLRSNSVPEKYDPFLDDELQLDSYHTSIPSSKYGLTSEHTSYSGRYFDPSLRWTGNGHRPTTKPLVGPSASSASRRSFGRLARQYSVSSELPTSSCADFYNYGERPPLTLGRSLQMVTCGESNGARRGPSKKHVRFNSEEWGNGHSTVANAIDVLDHEDVWMTIEDVRSGRWARWDALRQESQESATRDSGIETGSCFTSSEDSNRGDCILNKKVEGEEGFRREHTSPFIEQPNKFSVSQQRCRHFFVPPSSSSHLNPLKSILSTWCSFLFVQRFPEMMGISPLCGL